MAKVKKLIERSKVKDADTWDLSSLAKNPQDWEKTYKEWESQIPNYEKFKGKLAESAQSLRDCLDFDTEFSKLGERIGTYAYLKVSEDAGDSDSQAMKSKYVNVASRAGQASSYIRPEILAISNVKMNKFLADPVLADYKLALERMVRHKPHTLSESEENLIAQMTEMAMASGQIFGQLNNVDLKFGTIKIKKGESQELSHATFSTCLHSQDRKLRKKAFHQYYAEYADHANTIAATLTASIQRDAFFAKARNYPSALESSLFDDNVPVSVYDNLVSVVRSRLPALYRYYELRRRAMKLKDIHQYDTYVPIVSRVRTKYSWEQAVQTVVEALEPLGKDYCLALEKGLKGRWCDKYENKGKQSGAFSSGSFEGEPYILMNYQEEVVDHVFTLAHEAGHSMHSYYSARNQPFQYYDYTIFVAEVASTFNEQLLGKHMLSKAKSKAERAFHINRELDEIRGTIFRQTMFAEFEKITHALVEANEPLTLERLQSEYWNLLTVYFGPDFKLDDELKLECLRIPHFYRGFYVYKYATGLSAAIALADRVTSGGKKELDDYLGFLKGGCSKYPLDLLRGAGVDLEKPEPVNKAMDKFEQLVAELDELV